MQGISTTALGGGRGVRGAAAWAAGVLAAAGGATGSLGLPGAACVGGVVFGVVAGGAAVAQPAEERTDRERLADFIHFVNIARYDVAGALGEELLSGGMTAAAFVSLVEDARELQRFESAIGLALRVPELERVAAGLDKLYRDGKLERARDPEEIRANIELLRGGTALGAKIGSDRLLAAGEYAMPQLLEVLVRRDDPGLRARVEQVIVRLGRQAVAPLTAALPELDLARQELVASLLGRVPYGASLPYLVELHQNAGNDAVSRAAAEAVRKLGGTPSDSAAPIYAALAEGYYAEKSELTSFPGEPVQLLWSYDPSLGLVMTPIATEVFHEAMAMRLAETALRLDGTLREAAAVWLAANASREIDTPEGYDNPAYASSRPDAAYYALAAGPNVVQRVLRRAIDDRDTPLVRRAIAALSQTAGSTAALGDDGLGRRSLLEALNYRDRRVRYDAALALAGTGPTETFSGSEVVVPLLASAVSDGAARSAVVLSGDDREEYDRLRKLLEAEGYAVLPPADGGLRDIEVPLSETPAVDLVVVSMSMERAVAAIEASRSEPKLAVSPLLVLAGAAESEAMRRQFAFDRTVVVRRSSITGEQFAAAVQQTVEEVSGGALDEASSAEYSRRSLAVLRDLAMSRNPVLRVEDAATPLIAALGRVRPGELASVADVLSHMDEPRAQRALMDAAIDASGSDQVLLLGSVGRSARLFGNRLESRHVEALAALTRGADQRQATAAAAVLGALNLPGEGVVPLILDGAGKDALGRASAR